MTGYILRPADAALDEAIQAAQRGDPAGVITAARRVVELDPQKLQAWWLWGMAALDSYLYQEAETVLAEGMNLLPANHPARVRFLAQRVRALTPLGRYAEASEASHQALAMGVDDAETLHLLATHLTRASREAEALPLLERATTLQPDAASYWFSRGETEAFLGKLDTAEASFEKAVALVPHMGAHLALARLKRWTTQNNHIERLLAISPGETALHKASHAYALFKEYDDIDDRAAAWEWLQKGAEFAREEPETPRNPAWSSRLESEIVAAWRTWFPAAHFARPSVTKRTGPRRIFIIGLPRSGTTLMERILAAHSQVQAPGELQAFPAAMKMVSKSQTHTLLDADMIATAAKTDPQAYADFYERETAYLDNGCPYMIDKLPNNTDYLGLIRLAFPDALFVHMRRNPLDSLFGAYKLHFATRWSFDQNDLADHYGYYRDLMRHWETCFGDDIIQVSLEALIQDPEAHIRRVLEACGLPFETACLNPHEAEGAVASASSSQVRKPINSEGVGAWQRYASGLIPLRARLEAMGAIDENGDATN
jgi:tetratricopeptide (TPR) repeat protein